MYKSFQLRNTPENFMAGKTALNINKWLKITSDKWILKTICGYTVEVTARPYQKQIPKPIKFSDIEQLQINAELDSFLKKGIIEPVQNPEKGEFYSNIFIRAKPDGGIRIILNLKPFNKKFCEKIHFKMETLKSAVSAMTRNCFMASIDLKDAYYSIPIRSEDRKYFRFLWNGQSYQFTSLIMGLTDSPRVYTKILKPVFSELRKKGHISSIYLDDSWLMGKTLQQCEENVVDTVTLLDNLGFTVHDKKSVFVPSKEIVFVGFILNSDTMTIKITPEKKDKIISFCFDILKKQAVTIRTFAKLIGKLVATEPGVEFAQLRYKPLERIKDYYLKIHKGNFDGIMPISSKCKGYIQWWIDNLPISFKVISHGKPSVVLYTDSSNEGWGAVNKSKGSSTGGQWSAEEKMRHINYLELKAALLGLQALCHQERQAHIRIYMDNTTSCAYLKNFGGKKQTLNKLAQEIWTWCIDRNIWLSVAHVAGVRNVEADIMSRKFNDDLEWSIKADIFQKIEEKFGKFDIDLFASRLNNKLANYVSYRPDPQAFAIDAFSIPWNDLFCYIFAPFSCIPKVLQKLVEDETTAVVIAPVWPTQNWWSPLLQLIAGQPYILPAPKHILFLPQNPEKIHPLRKMTLAAFPLSGKHSCVKTFRERLPVSFSNHGEDPLESSMIHTYKNGWNFQVDRKQIRLIPL